MNDRQTPYAVSYQPNKEAEQYLRTLRFKNKKLTNKQILNECVKFAMSNNLHTKKKWDI